MAPKEWGIAKTRPKKSIYGAGGGGGGGKFVSSFDGFDDVTCA